MELFNISGKIAIVSGGYGHLGRAFVKVLQEAGAVVYVGGRDEEKFEIIFKEVKNVHFLHQDISSEKSLINSFKQVGQRHGGIDILFNNAYFGKTNHPEKMTRKEWDKGIEGGLNCVFSAIQAVLPHMKSTGGKIINIGSMYGVSIPELKVYDGREEFLNPPNYGVAKAGVLHLTKYYALVLAKYKINVNSISPGPFPNAEVQKDQDFIRRLEDETVIKRIGRAEDLAGTAILLASSASDYITGQNILVDGGWTI